MLLIYYLWKDWGKGRHFQGLPHDPSYLNGSYFIGQRINVMVLPAAKYIHLNYALSNWRYDHKLMNPLKPPWNRFRPGLCHLAPVCPTLTGVMVAVWIPCVNVVTLYPTALERARYFPFLQWTITLKNGHSFLWKRYEYILYILVVLQRTSSGGSKFPLIDGFLSLRIGSYLETCPKIMLFHFGS